MAVAPAVARATRSTTQSLPAAPERLQLAGWRRHQRAGHAKFVVGHSLRWCWSGFGVWLSGGSGGRCERDRDFETSFRAWMCREAGFVGLGDGLDDGQAEAVSVVMADTLAACLLEGLEEPVDLVGRDSWSAVTYGDGRLSGRRYGRDLDRPVGGVVAQGVVYEVGDQPFDQCGIACGWAPKRGWHGRGCLAARLLVGIRRARCR